MTVKRAKNQISNNRLTKRNTMKNIPKDWFNPECQICPRLSAHLTEIAARYPTYHCRPVPPFGSTKAKLLIVGLAPGRHGANATGRVFTGDHAGILLYETLYELGIASQLQSTSSTDSMSLNNCRITNAVKCLPPKNKPTAIEVAACNRYLNAEVNDMSTTGVIVALGRLAHNAILKALSLKLSETPFGHGSEYHLSDGKKLISSYHCSRYNTQTRRLTKVMFYEVLKRAALLAAIRV